MILIYAGSTSQTIDVFIPDSSSATGAGKTGLAFNTASLVAYYRKGATGSATSITLATQTVGGAYSSGGFVEIDATNMPGLYRLDLPNAAVDTAGLTHIMLKGAASMAPTVARIMCSAVAADAKFVGGTSQTGRDIGASVLLSSGTGTGQVKLSSGYVAPNWGDVGNPTTSVNLSGTTISTSQTIATVTTVTNQLTAAAIATGVWQDATSGDFTVASSIGKALYIANVAPGAAGGHFIAGSNATTTVNITGNLTGNVTGSVGSVTAAITLPTIPTDWITANGVAADAIGSSELAASAATEIATAVLDAFATASDSVQASPSPTTTAFAGSSSLSSTDSWYVGSVLVFTSGTLDGIARKITSYTGSTRLITVTAAWPTAPTAADTFRILGRID